MIESCYKILSFIEYIRSIFNIKEIVKSLKRNLYILIFVFSIFLVSFLISTLLIYDVRYFSFLGNEIFNAFKKELSSKVSFSYNYSFLYKLKLYELILSNNLKVCILNYILGVFSLIILLINTFIISYVLIKFGLKKFIVLILPHGIFEIPALLLSISSGIILYIGLVKYILKKEDYKVYILDSLRILLLSITLFIIAGFVESFITFTLAKSFLG
ncbi:stage II sporulation protein M [Methanocaldococcus sp.]